MPHQPLTPQAVHPALRFLLPVLTAFSWFIAYSWATITPRELAGSAVLEVLDRTPSLDLWAAGTGAGAALMTLALVAHRKALFTYALAVTLGVYLVMATVSAVAAWEGLTSSSAWAWPAFVSVASAACIWGLNSREDHA